MLSLIAANSVPSRAEMLTTEQLLPLPGIVLCNTIATGKKRSREIDLLLITPLVLASLEVKGTRLKGEVLTFVNQDWTIGGTKADFAGGANPLRQARTAAAVARGQMDSKNVAMGYYIHAIVVIVGDVEVQPHKVGDTWVCSLTQVAGVLMRLGANANTRAVSEKTATAVVRVFGFNLENDDLGGQAFSQVDDTMPVALKTKVSEKRERRRLEMNSRAIVMWQKSHRRRVIASGFGGVFAIIYLFLVSWQSVTAGFCITAVIAAYQLLQRHQIQGERLGGVWSLLIWLITLLPYLGAGTAFSFLVLNVVQFNNLKIFLVSASICIGTALLLITLVGRCGFIYPPPIVMEKNDVTGRPLGIFLLVEPWGHGLRYDGQLIDVSDPRSKIIKRT